MTDAEPLFIDTNILIYANVANTPQHERALRAIKADPVALQDGVTRHCRRRDDVGLCRCSGKVGHNGNIEAGQGYGAGERLGLLVSARPNKKSPDRRKHGRVSVDQKAAPSTESAAVFSSVTSLLSMIAANCPCSGSNMNMAPWMVGRPIAGLPPKTATDLTPKPSPLIKASRLSSDPADGPRNR